MFSTVSVRALGPKCFKSRKLVTLQILSKYASLWFRNGEREGWKGGAGRNCHQSIVNRNWIALQRRCFNMENENCSVVSRIDNMTIAHWKWMTAVALQLRAQGEMNECYKFFQNGPLFHKSPALPPNKYTPAFHDLSKFSISLQSNLLPVASKCQCQVPAWRICSSWEMPSQNAMQDLCHSSAEERARDRKMPMPRCVWTDPLSPDPLEKSLVSGYACNLN